jgi:hypothetical protein
MAERRCVSAILGKDRNGRRPQYQRYEGEGGQAGVKGSDHAPTYGMAP